MNAVIFDLGNVLLHFNHRLIPENFSSLLGRQLTEQESQDMMHLGKRFEQGEFPTEVFLERLRTLLQVPSSVQNGDLGEAWSRIFWPNNPVVEMAHALSAQANLVLLSNTNELHFEFVKERFPQVIKPFRHFVLSYVENLTKPDMRIYLRAIESIQGQPDQCLYFDDVHEYVKTAASIGIHAYQYVSPQSLRNILVAYDLLRPNGNIRNMIPATDSFHRKQEPQ